MGEQSADHVCPKFQIRIKGVLLFISVALALFSLSKYFAGNEKTRDNLEARTPFAYSHLFDPKRDGRNYSSWKRRDWIEWLHRRDSSHERAWNALQNLNSKKKRAENSPRTRRSLLEKGINSVIVATVHEFVNAFPIQTGGRDARYIWSDIRLSSFVFQRDNRGTLHVFRCPPMYFKVMFLPNGEPVHLERHSKTKNEDAGSNWGKVKPHQDCIELN